MHRFLDLPTCINSYTMSILGRNRMLRIGETILSLYFGQKFLKKFMEHCHAKCTL